MGLLLDWQWLEENIMPLGAFKAALMGTAGVSTGDVVLLSTQTASDSATISFTSDITSTYGEYIFKFYNINPATDDVDLTFQVNATDGADYDDSAITSTSFRAQHKEADDQAEVGYITGSDQAQGTAFQPFLIYLSNGSDDSGAGEMHLFNPASTTYVKHFYSQSQAHTSGPRSYTAFISGYIDDTTAIDDIQFKMASGNFDGTIKMWGVK
jgi:hypothetical protein